MKNYKTYKGDVFEGLEKFLREGLIIASTAEIMKRRINNEGFFNEGTFDTSDLALYSKANKNKVKFVFTVNNQNQIIENKRWILEYIQKGYLIRKCGSEDSYYDDCINLMGQYEEVEGVEVSRENFPEKTSLQTESEILNNKLLRILARHPDEVPKEFAEDKNLLKEYAKWVQLRTKDSKYLPVNLDYCSSSDEKLRIVRIDTAYDLNTFSKGLISPGENFEHSFHFVGYLEKERSKNSLQSVL